MQAPKGGSNRPAPGRRSGSRRLRQGATKADPDTPSLLCIVCHFAKDARLIKARGVERNPTVALTRQWIPSPRTTRGADGRQTEGKV